MKSKKEFIFQDSMSIGCIFKVQKFKEDGTITYDGPEFHNMVLDQGLDAMRTTSIHYLTKRCHVGTNGTAVSGTETGLLSPVGYLEDHGITYGGESTTTLPYAYKRNTWLFPVGTVSGTLRELGLSSTSDLLFNRQLFRDIYGDPTTISVAEDEGLRVFAEIRLYGAMNITDTDIGSFIFVDETAGTSGTISYTMKINGSAFITTIDDFSLLHAHDGYTLFESENGGYNRGGKMFISSATTGFTISNEPTLVTAEPYVEGSHETIFECYWSANSYSGDINSISTGNESDYGDELAIHTFYLDTPISITENEEFRFTFKRSWGRYTP